MGRLWESGMQIVKAQGVQLGGWLAGMEGKKEDWQEAVTRVQLGTKAKYLGPPPRSGLLPPLANLDNTPSSI